MDLYGTLCRMALGRQGKNLIGHCDVWTVKMLLKLLIPLSTDVKLQPLDASDMVNVIISPLPNPSCWFNLNDWTFFVQRYCATSLSKKKSIPLLYLMEYCDALVQKVDENVASLTFMCCVCS